MSVSDAEVQQMIAKACLKKLAVSFCEAQALAVCADFFGDCGAFYAMEQAREACEVIRVLLVVFLI